MKKTLMFLLALLFASTLISMPAFAQIGDDDDDDFVGEVYYFCPGDYVVWICHEPGTHTGGRYSKSSGCKIPASGRCTFSSMPSGCSSNEHPMLVGAKACSKGHRIGSGCTCSPALTCDDFDEYMGYEIALDEECYDACMGDDDDDDASPPM